MRCLIYTTGRSSSSETRARKACAACAKWPPRLIWRDMRRSSTFVQVEGESDAAVARGLVRRMAKVGTLIDGSGRDSAPRGRMVTARKALPATLPGSGPASAAVAAVRRRGGFVRVRPGRASVARVKTVRFSRAYPGLRHCSDAAGEPAFGDGAGAGFVLYLCPAAADGSGAAGFLRAREGAPSVAAAGRFVSVRVRWDREGG